MRYLRALPDRAASEAWVAQARAHWQLHGFGQWVVEIPGEAGFIGVIGLSVVFLMSPPAYHRIVERGELTERFHRYTGRMLLAAMIPLALGLCGDFFVVAQKVTHSFAFALASSLALFLFFAGLWFGYTLYLRAERERGRRGRLQPVRQKAV